ncbi:MAG: zinc-ribbon domain-containing protein [Clostridiales bacterium]|nr:zinc-ribbon domain-containing protein [Clostridiales bacterium]
MKYCKYCGAQLDDDAVVCSSCGKKLDEQQPAQTIIVQQVEKPEQKKNGCGVAGFVIGLISLVICSWLCIFLGWYTLALPCLAFVLSLVGIIVGKKKQQSIGLGIAGLILSAVALITVISVVSFLYSVI